MPAPPVTLPGGVDSNSPGVWRKAGNKNTLYVFTSIDGTPSMSTGIGVGALGSPAGINLSPWPEGGNWFESVIAAADGAWYGFYHNERRAFACDESVLKVAPAIGVARSRNQGRSWTNLGIILSSPPDTDDCGSPNTFFVGGVGDFSVMLDDRSEYLYIFYSQYVSEHSRQGVAVARFAWADRNRPVGKVRVNVDGVWTSPVQEATPEGPKTIYPMAVPVFPATDSWHDVDGSVDAFWGPSVHWNTAIQQYVMLLNRAADSDWRQEGIYISFAPRLDDPRLWSRPTKLLEGGLWYPQVFGLETGVGTDKSAGAIARFFMGGRSEYLIQFKR